MKKWLVFAAIVVLTLSSWYVYSNIVQSRREGRYQEALAPFQRNLHPGMSRGQVDRCLESQKFNYAISGGDAGYAWSYHVLIGQEPGGFPCDRWSVYVAINFDTAKDTPEAAPLPEDTLRSIRIKKIGHCL